MTNRAQDFSRIEVEASEWLVAMSDRSVSLEERSRFEAWLSTDPEHERIYQIQKTAWSTVARMPQLLDETSPLDASLLRHSPLQPAGREITGFDRQPEGLAGFLEGEKVLGAPRMKYFALAAALALITIGLFLARNQFPFFKTGDAFETSVAQVKDVKLSDDTLVTLGASSHIDVDFRKSERRVVLTRGEAFFEVTRDTSRPFFVTAGQTLVRVVGTKFDVHYGTEAVRVAVLEGRVEILKADDATFTTTQKTAVKQVLTAGRAAVAEPTGEIATTDSVKTEDLGAWRHGRLVYVDTRLRDVVADINRYYNGKIDLADGSTGEMRLTTAFRVDQIDRMLEVLQRALPVDAMRTADGRIVLSEKAPRP